ncbi:MAG TPA: PIN domain-containing protein [Thermoplasmata archaeon]|nr:PIN domain-containing protein [Thermoplasmata archaeon]
MRTVVLDASVLVACLFKDGRARHVLLHSSEVRFLAPPDLLVESERQLPRVARRAGITPGQARATLRILRGRVHEVPLAVLRPVEARARSLARAAGDENDWEYVALALTLGAPIWTYDDDLRRVKEIRTVGTSRIMGPD